MLILSQSKVSSSKYSYGLMISFILSLGMGRAIHTNLNASFKTESIKLAVIKVEITIKSMK